MRDVLMGGEPYILVRLLKAGVPWEQIRVSLPDVTPEGVDTYKEWALEKAGIEAEEDETVALEEKAQAEAKVAEAAAKVETARAVKEAARAAKAAKAAAVQPDPLE